MKSERKIRRKRKLVSRGIGIDVISYERILQFSQEHPQQITKRLLTKKEVRDWKRRGRSADYLAKYLTAKEAFFKALGQPWMGPDGFSRFEVNMLRGEAFEIKELNKASSKPETGQFFRNHKWVGAHIALWN